MSGISATAVKELREISGAGMMDCKKALSEASGNLDKAMDILRKSGIAKAQKKTGRSTKEGLIYSYIHPGSKLGVLIEINCETDFVAKTDDFINLTKDLAMHIAASEPIAIKREDISFEIPNAQTFLMIEKDILNYNLNFDISSKPFKENIIEVSTILKLAPNQNVKHKMLTEINLTSLVTIDKNIRDKTELEKIILVKIPTEVYPTLYETFLFLYKQAGLKNVAIKEQVDFEKMYKEKKKP